MSDQKPAFLSRQTGRAIADICTILLIFFAPMLMVFSTRSLATTLPLFGLAGGLVLAGSVFAFLTGSLAARILLAGTLGLMVVSLAWTPDPAGALRYSAATMLVIVSGYGATHLLRQTMTPARIKLAALGVILLAVLLIIVLASSGMPRSALGLQAEAYRMNRPALTAAVLMVPILALLSGIGARVWMAAVFCAVMGVAAFTESQATVFFLLVAGVVFVVAEVTPRFAYSATALAGCVAILAMPWLVDFISTALSPTLKNAFADAHLAERIDIWISYRQLISMQPILGLGLEASRAIDQIFDPSIAPPGLARAIAGPHPHNAPLQIWVEFGLVGALLASMVWLAAIRAIAGLCPQVRSWGTALLASLMAVACVSHGAWQAWWLALIALALALLWTADGRISARAQSRGAVAEGRKPRILYLITEDWFFRSHFIGFAHTAQAMGLEVVVAARCSSARPDLEAQGIRVIEVPERRGAASPWAGLRTIMRYARIIANVQPDIVHCIALKPVLLGSIASRIMGHRRIILSTTGLGTIFLTKTLPMLGARILVRASILLVARGEQTIFLFENPDDPARLALTGRDRIVLVPGAGVDSRLFEASQVPPVPPLRLAVVSRLVEAKGIADAVGAVRIVRARGFDIRLDLWGLPDQDNHGAISTATLQEWSREPGIAWRGHSDDIAAVWRANHVGILLSYGEGLPRAVIEAKACGRAMIVTDVPGCRHAVRDRIDGFLVASRDQAAAAERILEFVTNPALASAMGREARRDFEARFTLQHVQAIIRETYASIIEGDAEPSNAILETERSGTSLSPGVRNGP